MTLPVWSVWIFLAVLFLLSDVLARGGLGICLSFGALAAAVTALCGTQILWQWLVFLGTGSLLGLLIRAMKKQ